MFGEGEDYCKHDNVLGYCRECKAERDRIEAQKQHDLSVARQKARLIIAPWRTDETLKAKP
jgi:hypothetical protein